jgi:hypothetical protein
MSVYENIYQLVNTYIFNGSIVTGSYQDLVTIILSTIACVYLVALPFLVVRKLLNLIGG